MLLSDSGVDVPLAGLVEQVYLPGRRGTLTLELLAASRAHGRIPYRIDGTATSLAEELRAGRPVLVLQNLGVSWLPRWHYAVLIGLDPDDRRVILRSGTDRRRVTPLDTFLRTWRRGEYFGIVLLAPGELPATASAARYFDAVAAMEASGQAMAARAGWQAALERWPGEETPLLGLGNAALSLGNHAAAEGYYRTLLDRSGSHLPAMNNLAYALAGQGRNGEAVAVLEEALVLATGDPMQAVIADSLAEIAAKRGE